MVTEYMASDDDPKPDLSEIVSVSDVYTSAFFASPTNDLYVPKISSLLRSSIGLEQINLILAMLTFVDGDH